MSKRILMTGGTGFVGSHLARKLSEQGHAVAVLTRSSARGRSFSDLGMSVIEGDPTRPGLWQEVVAEQDVVINLAGASIFTPWTARAREAIKSSRLSTTRHIVDAMAATSRKLTLINASGVGYYGGRTDDTVFSETGEPGDDFLAQISREWEKEALRAENFGVRVVLCRFGIILGRGGGALSTMLPVFRSFLGSRLGSGRQWFPWIHQEDLSRIILFLIDNPQISGPVNCTAPQPVTNDELTRSLAASLRRPLLLPPVPGFLLRTLLGDFGKVFLTGQRAIPRKLLDEGFLFRFPTLDSALSDLLG